MAREEFDPVRESAGEFHEVIEVLEPRFFEQVDEIGYVIGRRQRADENEIGLDAEFVVGEVQDPIDLRARQRGALERIAADGDGRCGGGDGERHGARGQTAGRRRGGGVRDMVKVVSAALPRRSATTHRDCRTEPVKCKSLYGNDLPENWRRVCFT